MKTGLEFASRARNGGYIGIPYKKLDCQGFVEKVLWDLTGTHYNWRGSNHMWRDAMSWKGTYAEALEKFGKIPAGAWLFTVKHDGKEPSYYKDGINAAHVGIYIPDGLCIHSTTGGVQWGVCPATRWTHVGLCKYLDYENEKEQTDTAACTCSCEGCLNHKTGSV